MSLKNSNTIEAFLNDADKYIDTLKLNNSLVLDTARHTGFLGLKVCISSFKVLYKTYIHTEILKFLPSHKLSQDHI